MTAVKQVQVTFDCTDPRTVAEFWKATLGARRLHLLPADGQNEACLVMQDVEGNEFSLD